jgi:adenosylcobinamide-GDP ribazoletransferase
MKRGVVTVPCGVWKQPQRAWVWGQRAVIVKPKGGGVKLMGPRRRCPDARAPLPVSQDVHTPEEHHQPRGPGWLRDLAGAWIFYSVLPAWPWPTPRFQRIARFAPVIGLVLGGLQSLLWWATAGWLPLAAQVGLVMALALLLSGGLHHDGALDTADGLAAGPRSLQAMADSRVGAAAVQTALVLALLRATGLLCLAAAAPLPLVWSAFWGRCAPLLAMAWFPYLRRQPGEGGTAGFHRRHWLGLGRELRPALVAAGLLVALSLAAAGPGPFGSPLAPASQLGLGLLPCLPAVVVPRWLGARLGGHSGDSYGACVEWTEALGLLLMGLVLRGLAAQG